MRPGTTHHLAFESRLKGRVDESEVELAIEAEEDVETPAGRFRTVRVKRTSKWATRGNRANGGEYEATYWYSGAVKRYVAMERKSTHKGKVLMHERLDLLGFDAR